MATISLDNVRHSYMADPADDADWALKRISVDWKDGGAYALLGPSGCGKTTLLNLVSGLLRPTEGRILFDGKDVTGATPENRNIAQVFQFPVIYDTMTVYDNLAFPLRNRGVGADEVDRRVRDVAAMLELDTMLRQRAAGLTADGKQKISLGRGLVRSDVNVIMFDEPLTVIDPHLKWVLRSKLKELHQRIAAHDDLCHPRPDRGPDLRRSGRRHESGGGRADRNPGRAVRAAQPHLRRAFHRLAGNERPPRRGPRRQGLLRRAAGRDDQCRRPSRFRRPPRDRRTPGIRRTAPIPAFRSPSSRFSMSGAIASSSPSTPATSSSCSSRRIRRSPKDPRSSASRRSRRASIGMAGC